ncbi:hypothetical protein REPUB_Repub16aG0056000 [Reevesia pubescens]
MYFGYYRCYVVKPGVFAFGAVLAAASVILGIFYYLTLNTTGPRGNAPVPNQVDIAMGQPQFPPLVTNQGGKAMVKPQFPPPVPNQGGIAMVQPQFPPLSSQDPVFVHEGSNSLDQKISHRNT